MQLVLLDTSSSVTDVQCSRLTSRTHREEKILKLLVDPRILRSKVMKRKRDEEGLNATLTFSCEERLKNELVSEILADDISPLKAYLTLNKERRTVAIHMSAGLEAETIFKKLRDRYKGHVKLSVYLKYASNEHGELKDFVSIEGMVIARQDKFRCSGSGFIKTNLTTFDSNPVVTMKLVADVPDKKISGKKMPFARRILEKKSFSDVTISAGNGAVLKAHKCFLTVCSPVLASMLQSGMEEFQTGHLDMTDVSEHCVKAFLQYVYFGNLGMAEQDTAVGFELLYIAHKYDVSLLESEIMKCLVERRNEDFNFSVGLAFKIYMFVRNVGYAVKLKEKIVQVLKSKVEELNSLKEYSELFENPANSQTAKELLIDFAKSP